ncbi:MAG: CvpA family protein [Eubacterium sp.]|nr:CvpA family protein [Eubacterium sp.]
MNWLLITTICVMAAFGLIGYLRGLVRTVLGLCATVIALVLSFALTPVVTNWIVKGTSLDEKIEEKVYSMVADEAKEQVRNEAQERGITITDSDVKIDLNKNPDKGDQVELIRGIELPEFLTQMLLDGNNEQGYRDLGVKTVYQYISRTAATIFVRVLAGILTFIVIRLLLIIVTVLVGRVMKALPIVGAVDKAVGAVVGVLIGLLVVWLIMFLLSLFMKQDSYRQLMLDNSGLQWLSDHNLIRKAILRR